MIETSNDSYLHQQKGLANLWYPFSFVHEVKTAKPLRRIILGIPIVLWRLKNFSYKAFVDRCPHRQAPLSAGKLANNKISCPYHGWEFNQEGRCVHIPSMPQAHKLCKKISLQEIRVEEDQDFLWICINNKDENNFPDNQTFSKRKTIPKSWKRVHLQKIFHVEIEDLIENFMDSPHTAFVHSGLIRKKSKPKPRQFSIEMKENEVSVEYEPKQESLGFFNKVVNPHNEAVFHQERFIAPSLVEISYHFGRLGGNFNAFLALAPIGPKETRLFISIGLDFSWLNHPIAIAIKLLAKIILAQDAWILGQQRSNYDLSTDYSKKSILTDSIDIYVRHLRARMRQGKSSSVQFKKKRKLEAFF